MRIKAREHPLWIGSGSRVDGDIEIGYRSLEEVKVILIRLEMERIKVLISERTFGHGVRGCGFHLNGPH